MPASLMILSKKSLLKRALLNVFIFGVFTQKSNFSYDIKDQILIPPKWQSIENFK